jgi:NAD(P)-dependent dehydrogenase (short-subunit alcohol dehydrogenase family)
LREISNYTEKRAGAAGKTAIVTGGTRRLGRYVSEVLAKIGFDIVATYSDRSWSSSPDLTAFREMIESHGVQCSIVNADFLNPSAELMSRVCDACPSALYGLVNNAAMFHWDSLESLQVSSMDHTISVNLIAPMLLTSEFCRRIKRYGSTGIALFMLDQKIFNPYPDHCTYTVCKAALNMFMTMCARDRTGPDIKFYGLAPGLVLPAAGQDPQTFADAQKSVLLGTSPSPEEIQRCVEFLFTGIAASGYVLRVDGGASITGRERDFAFFSAEQRYD